MDSLSDSLYGMVWYVLHKRFSPSAPRNYAGLLYQVSIRANDFVSSFLQIVRFVTHGVN